MGRRRDNTVWKRQFGVILKRLFSMCKLDYTYFTGTYHCSESTVRYWFSGRNLPQPQTLNQLKEFFVTNMINDEIHNEQIYEEISCFFAHQDALEVYHTLRRLYPEINNFVAEVLSTCYDFSKQKFALAQLAEGEIVPTNKTQAVVFDFDGTLTSGKTGRTTWERLWMDLGYSVKVCQELHLRYDRKEITHAEWCKLTEERFCERRLHKDMVNKISSEINLIKGIRETFLALENQNIKIYIVSGSIRSVIRSVLGGLCEYIETIKANEFRFDSRGYLTEIIGTKYDFEGKATFISEIATELAISPKDILFVGNSINDRFAYISTARTLCINPRLTDTTDRTVWNECIPTCDDLTEILNYL